MRTFRRLGKAVLVWLAVVLLSIEPAMACRWFSWRFRQACCPCYVECEPVVTCCPSDSTWGSDFQAPLSEDCGSCGSVVPRENDFNAPAEPEVPPSGSVDGGDDDLFSPRGAEQPSEPPKPEVNGAQPAEPAAPVETPADDEDLFEPRGVKEPNAPSAEDDLFGPNESDNRQPAPEGNDDAVKPRGAEQPSQSPEAEDDLFGPSKSEEPSKAPESDDDLFGPQPSEQPKKSPDSEDDLFGPPSSGDTDKTTEILESEPGLAQQKQTAPVDTQGWDAGGLRSKELRTWVDNTGRFTVRGRLVEILAGKVRILKENGRTTTVPLSRLSQQDSQFVAAQRTANQSKFVSR